MYAITKSAPTAWALTGAITSRSTLAIAGRGITAMQALSGFCTVLTVGMLVMNLISASRANERGR